jgi:hypothetical protein
MVKRKIAWELYVISALITFLILSLGIYFGIFLSKEKIQKLQNELNDLKLRQEDLTIELALLTSDKNMSCKILSYELEKVIEDASKLGDSLTTYETTEKIKDENFHNLKRDYTLTLLRYWIYLEEMKKSCNKTDFITILYFYSNMNCKDCQRQGIILTYFKQIYPQNVMIFALDYDTDLNILALMKKTYDVKTVPTIVVEGKKYEGLVTLEELKQICAEHELCKQ